MIPVSLLVVVVGGWTAVYLADLVLKVRASGLRPQPAESRAGAHGPVSPKAFSLPLRSLRAGPGAAPSARRVCVRSPAWRIRPTE